MAGPRRRADRRHPLRRSARQRDPARLPVPQLGPRRLPGLDHGLGDDRRGHGGGRQPAPRPLRDAALLRVQHGRLLRATGSPSPSASTKARCPRSSTSTGSARVPRAAWLWPGFGENSRVLEWIFERTAGRGEAIETRDRLRADARGHQRRGLDVSDADMEQLLRVDARRVAQRGAADPRALRPVQRPPARGARTRWCATSRATALN